MRSGLLSRVWPHANGSYKVLWLPLHDPRERRDALLLRGTRIGHPADSIRIRVPEAAANPRATGFPSLVSFPKAGQWVVVATAGNDWGCFLVTMSTVEFDGFTIGPSWRTP
jgi:hypothetical protein